MSKSKPKQICIIGSGNWGTILARIVGRNALKYSQIDNRVNLYVYDETIGGRSLADIINITQENVKYLSGYKIPSNVVAVPDIVEACKDADIIMFVVPHHLIRIICSTLLGKIKQSAYGLSLMKGFDQAKSRNIDLISTVINNHLKIPCSVLMGLNLPGEVANEKFCECTLGCKGESNIACLLRDTLQTEYLKPVIIEDAKTVELCGSLKNIIACGAGFLDGLGFGACTKAVIFRLGIIEIIKFIDFFYPGGKLLTILGNCGIPDIIITCFNGRNRKICEIFAQTGRPIKVLEREILHGQKLQGPLTAAEVNGFLKLKQLEVKFPLFTAIHKICAGQILPIELIDCIKNQTEHARVYVPKNLSI